jgi:hypothetical protein
MDIRQRGIVETSFLEDESSRTDAQRFVSRSRTAFSEVSRIL